MPAAKASGNPIVFIPCTLLTPSCRRTSSRPTGGLPFRQLMLDLIAEDPIPMPRCGNPIARSGWRSSGHPRRQGDLLVRAGRYRQGARSAGDVVALRGNVSPSTLTTGTPEDVDAAVKYTSTMSTTGRVAIILDAAFACRTDAGRERPRHVQRREIAAERVSTVQAFDALKQVAS